MVINLHELVVPLVCFSKQVLSQRGSSNAMLRGCTIKGVGGNWVNGNAYRSLSLSAPGLNEPDKSEAKGTVPTEQVPTILGRSLDFYGSRPIRAPREAWVESLGSTKENNLGIIHLHPSIFAAAPRLEVVHQNIHWQNMYKKINWDFAPSRAELSGGGRKPWPQKGLGRARHGSIRSPIFLKGGQAHGPRGPTTYFYMLPFYMRVKGLCTTLSIKLAQDDIKIVDSLEIPTNDPQYLKDLVAERQWGVSVLFVDDTDIMPKNIALAIEGIRGMHLMPVYGLNCFSMLKFETLVLTLNAVNRIEEKLLFHLHTNDPISRRYKGSGCM